MYALVLKLLFAFMVAVLLAGYACGGDDDTGGPTRTVSVPSVAGPRPQPQPAQPLDPPEKPRDGVFEISAAGGRFVGNYLAIPVGESVVIRLTNNDAAQHNLRIAGIDGQFETEDDAVIEPQTVEPGGLGELTFAPPVGGSYTFRCDFHPTTMGGQIDAGEPQVTPTPVVADSPAPSPSTQ